MWHIHRCENPILWKLSALQCLAIIAHVAKVQVDYVSMSVTLEEEMEENEIIKKWNADKLDGWMDGWMIENKLSLSSHYILLNFSQDYGRLALLAPVKMRA